MTIYHNESSPYPEKHVKSLDSAVICRHLKIDSVRSAKEAVTFAETKCHDIKCYQNVFYCLFLLLLTSITLDGKRWMWSVMEKACCRRCPRHWNSFALMKHSRLLDAELRCENGRMGVSTTTTKEKLVPPVKKDVGCDCPGCAKRSVQLSNRRNKLLHDEPSSCIPN